MAGRGLLDIFKTPQGLGLLMSGVGDAMTGQPRAMNNAVTTGVPTVIMERRRLYDIDVANWETSNQDVDWTIKRGPAPASLLLEAAYYGRATSQTGGF